MSRPRDVGIGSSLQRLAQVVREWGVRRLWFSILDSMGLYRRLVLFEVPLEDPPPSPAPPGPLEVRLLKELDLEDYREFRPDADLEEIRSRLQAGHQCFAAWQQGRLVSAMWAARGCTRIDYLKRDMDLAPDEAYAYDSHTVPELRGMALASVRADMMRRTLRETGVRRLLGTVMPENRSGLRRAEKRQHRRIGTIGYWKLGPWRRDFTRPAGKPEPVTEPAPNI